jgi:hypothetical protein
MRKVLTEDEAYAAMFAFLEDRYRRGPSDEFGGLLGSLSLLPSGSSADPAMQHDWAAAIARVRAGRVDLRLRLSGGDQ